MSEVAKAELRRYLQDGRDAIVWKLEGLSEYDRRRPLTPTGTNLLGLVKHLAGVEAEYFGVVFNRPFGEERPPGTSCGGRSTAISWSLRRAAARQLHESRTLERLHTLRLARSAFLSTNGWTLGWYRLHSGFSWSAFGEMDNWPGTACYGPANRTRLRS